MITSPPCLLSDTLGVASLYSSLQPTWTRVFQPAATVEAAECLSSSWCPRWSACSRVTQVPHLVESIFLTVSFLGKSSELQCRLFPASHRCLTTVMVFRESAASITDFSEQRENSVLWRLSRLSDYNLSCSLGNFNNWSRDNAMALRVFVFIASWRRSWKIINTVK